MTYKVSHMINVRNIRNIRNIINIRNIKKKAVSCMVLSILIVSLCACGREKKSDDYTDIYGETIGNLQNNELYAVIETNAPLPVLLIATEVYEDGAGNQAALTCDVYYLADKEVKNIGSIESMGTAYPISYDESGIYAASGHGMQRFIIEDSHIKLEEGIFEQFDENGNAAYTMEKEDQTEEITEKEYENAYGKYSNAAVVNFV